MANYTTIFGELVSFDLVPMHKNNYKFIVEKRVDGMFKTAYPVKSLGEAKMLVSRQIN